MDRSERSWQACLHTVTASADAAAVYACQNNGGNFANDPKKTQVSDPLTCPSGQHRVLVSVSSTNVQVSGGGDTASIPGTFSRTCFNI